MLYYNGQSVILNYNQIILIMHKEELALQRLLQIRKNHSQIFNSLFHFLSLDRIFSFIKTECSFENPAENFYMNVNKTSQ